MIDEIWHPTIHLMGIAFSRGNWDIDCGDASFGHIYLRTLRGQLNYGANNGAYCDPDPKHKELDIIHCAVCCMDIEDRMPNVEFSEAYVSAATFAIENLGVCAPSEISISLTGNEASLLMAALSLRKIPGDEELTGSILNKIGKAFPV